MAPLRWGIMSAGKISFDFAVAFKALPKSEHQVVAVGARSLDSAKEFAAVHKIPKAYGSYEELAKDPEIDVIYIGSVNPQHLPLGKLALNHGKHILCEKPLGVNVKEVKELIALAESKKLFLMEAIWSRFFPAYKRIRQEIDNGGIGEVLQVFVSFGLPISNVDRVKLKEMGGGGILDIGVYCVQFASFIFGGETPLKIVSGGHVNEHGVDESTSTTLIYKNGRTATLISHCKVLLPNEAFAVGTKGTIKLTTPFWCPTELTLPNGEVETFDLPKEEMPTNFGNSMGLHYQCHEVLRCINNGLQESPILSHKESILISEIMESIRKQLGVVYPQDG